MSKDDHSESGFHNESDVVIIGGGITGLAAAYRLQQNSPDLRVCLLEASHQPGGVIQTRRPEGLVMEAGPDSLLSRKPAGIALIKELGLADQLIGRRPENKQTFVWRAGSLHPLPEGLTGLVPTDLEALENSTLLTSEAVRCIAQESKVAPRHGDGEESVSSFVIRRFGRQVFENLMEPLLSGIYAGRADELSIMATFPQLPQLERRYGSVLQGLAERSNNSRHNDDYPPFVSLRQGMGQLIETLTGQIPSVQLHLDVAIASAWLRDDGKWLLSDKEGARTWLSRALILAVPAHNAHAILADNQPVISSELRQIPHASTVLVNLAHDRASIPGELKGYGYVIPAVEGQSILACTWSSQKWPNRAPEDIVLMRLYLGRYGDDKTSRSDSQLAQMVRQHLWQTLQIEEEPRTLSIQRWPKALPQYVLGHVQRLARIEAGLAKTPGLFLAGNYFHGVGIPDCIHSGQSAAEAVIHYLHHSN